MTAKTDQAAWNRGARIRARREALGRSLDDLANATKIPVQHLEAIEDGRLEDLPAGPYAAAWVKSVKTELALEDASEEAPAVVPPQGAPLWVVRALAVTSLFALFVVLVSFGWERVRPLLGTGADPTASPLADQHLELVARRSTVVKVVADGEVVHDGPLGGGETRQFDARDRIDLDVRSLADVTLRWNGEELVPQGVQDAPRRLRFVDDAGGADWPEE